MKKFIKKVLINVLGIRFFNLIIPLVSSTEHNIKKFSYSLNYTFFKDKNHDYIKVNQPLLLITQVQRSGGTLISQLLDNHRELHAFPSELILTNPKWDWSKKKNFISYRSREMREYSELGFYIKRSKANNDLANKFDFDLLKQRSIYESISKKTERDYFNAYFTSFFNSFDNYINNGKNKKFISAFTPRAIMYDKTISNFFSIYPDGHIVTVVRNPLSWLASATKHDKKYKKDLNASISIWKKSTKASITNAISNQNITLIIFEDFLEDIELGVLKLCKRLNLSFEKSLLTPTFNGNPVLSDSSFKASKGIDKSALDRSKLIDMSKIDTVLIEEVNALYEEAQQVVKKLYGDN